MLSGGCLCGDVAYEIEGPVEHLGSCHCRMCQKAHGTAFGTYGQIERARFRFTRGEGKVTRYASSREVERSFCSRCGSSLTYTHAALPAKLFVAAGGFDSDPGVRPEHHLFVGSKAPWWEILDELPQYDGFPDDA